MRRTCPAAPSVVSWAVLHSAARRWRAHGGLLRTATLAYLALLQRVGRGEARRVLRAWRAAAHSRCVHRARAPRADAHERQARLPMYLPYISPISPLYLPYISPISPLYFPYTSPISPLCLPYIYGFGAARTVMVPVVLFFLPATEAKDTRLTLLG